MEKALGKLQPAAEIEFARTAAGLRTFNYLPIIKFPFAIK